MKCYVCIPDVHSHERDLPAYNMVMTKALPYLHSEYGIDKIIQLGDLLDFNSISRFRKTRVTDRVFNYEEELEFARQFWKACHKISRKADLVWLDSNHQERIERYIIENIQEETIAKRAFNALRLNNIAKELGVKYVETNDRVVTAAYPIIKDKLIAVHGWSISKHVAAAHLNQIGSSHSIIMAHTHRIQSYIRRNPITNHAIGAWNIGTLSSIEPTYQKALPNEWNFGFAYIFHHDDYFQVNQVIIIDGQCIIDGKVIK